ncbi:hypothetical protein BVC93_24340 [Mycobacterium sp. MS1601]|nr:hypothetical protein BVC93_24340 [Mycobacterium sp. MS1601]
MLKHPLVVVATGAGALALDTAGTVYQAATRLPVVGQPVEHGVAALARRGDQVIDAGFEPARTALIALVVQIVEQVLDQMDLTALVRNRVDVNAIARELDLVGLANTVIDGVDLPAIIRESTTSVTAEVMTDVRTQGERADDLVAGIVDRMLGRRTDPAGPTR